MNNVCSSVPVDPHEHELFKPWDGGRLSSEAAQERVDPPSLPEIGREWGLIRDVQSELGRQSPDKTFGDSPGPEELSHQPRWQTAPGVGRGVRRTALPEAVGGAWVDEASAWVKTFFASLAVEDFSV